MSNRGKTLFHSSKQHISEETMIALLDGELSALQVRRAEKHLSSCWLCRSRRAEYERTIQLFVEYRGGILAAARYGENDGKERFLATLDAYIERIRFSIRRRIWAGMRRAWSAASRPSVLCAAAAVSLLLAMFLLFSERHYDPVAPAHLLQQASSAERTGMAELRDGVAYQHLAIRTHGQTIERRIYQDNTGNSPLQARAVNEDQAALQKKLGSAGVSWQRPLSANDYKAWHDSQRQVEDQVSREQNTYLKITSTLAEGPVAAQSLMVRANDFHTVSRTVQFRDNETVEIAELEYSVIPGSALKDELPDMFQHRTPAMQPPSVPLPARRLTASELDSAEIQVLLALNQLHADRGERIQTFRQPTKFLVRGIVDTEERKRQMESRLHEIGNVETEIVTLQQSLRRPSAALAVTGVSVSSMEAQPSPLARYLEHQGKSTDAGAALGNQVLDNAIAANRNAKAIRDLTDRFDRDEALDPAARAVLHQLIERRRSELIESVSKAAELLAQAGLAGERRPSGGDRSNRESASLNELSEKCYLLTVELVSGNSETSRTAEQISTELSLVLTNLRTRATESYAVSQQPQTANGRQ